MSFKSLINKIDLYNLMIFNLFIFSVIGVLTFGWRDTLPQLLISVVVALFLDTLIEYYKTKIFEISKSGLITGFFIGLVLAEGQNWYIPLVAVIIAILGKQFAQIILKKHIFNPAMVGIFFSILIFKTSGGWWGATNLIAVAILGLFLLYKFRRFHLAITFLFTYFIILFLLNFLFGNIDNFISNLLNSTLYFFAFFMLVEPKTSPINFKGRISYGIISGIVISLGSVFLAPYALTAGLLICNLFVPLINYFTVPKMVKII